MIATMARRILLLLLGAWLGATLFMWLVATQNFAVVENILREHPHGFAETVSSLGAEPLRTVLRYQASETNRLFFEGWGLVQPPLGALALLLAWRSGAGRFSLAALGIMLLIVVAFQLYVVPETVRLGRLLDFVPREPAPPEAAPFWRLHHTYTGLDMLKFLLGLATAFIEIRRETPAVISNH
jgi:hypothetical protein